MPPKRNCRCLGGTGRAGSDGRGASFGELTPHLGVMLSPAVCHDVARVDGWQNFFRSERLFRPICRLGHPIPPHHIFSLRPDLGFDVVSMCDAPRLETTITMAVAHGMRSQCGERVCCGYEASQLARA